jgi:DNA-binding response OmpR family regulator
MESVDNMSGFHKDQDNATLRFLIVDDEPHIRLSLTRALSLLGHNVHAAGSGQEAVGYLRKMQFDLIILDILMPDLDGIAVMEQLNWLQPDVQIIVLTGHASLKSAIPALKARVVDYLLKPASIETIVATVSAATERRLESVQKEKSDTISESLKMEATVPVQVPSLEDVIKCHSFRLELTRQQVIFLAAPQRVVNLTKGETAVLGTLMVNAQQVISCTRLAYLTWGYKLDQLDAESLIHPYIFRIRRKLETDPSRPDFIQTVHGKGYLFVSTDFSDSEK